MKLLRTFIYKVLYGHVLSFLLDKYLGMEIPINVGGVYLTLRNSQTFFQSHVPFHIPPAYIQVPAALPPHRHLVGPVFSF